MAILYSDYRPPSEEEQERTQREAEFQQHQAEDAYENWCEAEQERQYQEWVERAHLEYRVGIITEAAIVLSQLERCSR